MEQIRAATLSLRLLGEALADRTGNAVSIAAVRHLPESDAWLASGTLGQQSVTLAGVFVVPPNGATAWSAARAALEERLSGSVEGGYLLWVPPGAELSTREPLRSDLIMRVEERARTLAPGGHGEVRFPVALTLRKSDDEGTYMTVRGGLAPLWARFTGRVFGHYQLDSSELHRLPTGDGYATTLIDRIALEANGLSLGHALQIETEDAWTIQRLRGGDGFAIIGEPPEADLSSGASLRKHLRRTMQSLRPALIADPADLRIVGFVGPYATFEDQPVGTALLGMDPSLYGGIDMMLLAADGRVGPLLDLTRAPALAAVARGPGESEGWGV